MSDFVAPLLLWPEATTVSISSAHSDPYVTVTFGNNHQRRNPSQRPSRHFLYNVNFQKFIKLCIHLLLQPRKESCVLVAILKENTKGQSDFEGFHARSDSKLRYDNKNQTQLNSRIVHTVSYSKKKQNKTAMMKNIAKLA